MFSPKCGSCSQIVVRNLCPEMTESDLRTLFRTYGHMEKVNHFPAYSLAYIKYDQATDAAAAVRAAHGQYLQGYLLDVALALPHNQAKQTDLCFSLLVDVVGDSPLKLQGWLALKRRFAVYGPLVKERKISVVEGRFEFGYAGRHVAEIACACEHGANFEGKSLKVTLRGKESRDLRENIRDARDIIERGKSKNDNPNRNRYVLYLCEQFFTVYSGPMFNKKVPTSWLMNEELLTLVL